MSCLIGDVSKHFRHVKIFGNQGRCSVCARVKDQVADGCDWSGIIVGRPFPRTALARARVRQKSDVSSIHSLFVEKFRATKVQATRTALRDNNGIFFIF